VIAMNRPPLLLRAPALLCAFILIGCGAEPTDDRVQAAEGVAAAEAVIEPGIASRAAKQVADLELSEKPARAEGEAGRFRLIQSEANPTALEREVEELIAIGYVSGSVKGADVGEGIGGTTFYDAGRAEPGLNFYTSGHAPVALLVDMQGKPLHRWRLDFDAAWPERKGQKRHEWAHFLRRAHLFPNGDILAVQDSIGIAKLDAASNLLWANPILAHHDLEVMPSGEIYVLSAKVHKLPRINPIWPVREDFVTLLDTEGRVLRSVSLLEAFENSEQYRGILAERGRTRGELFHTNSLEVLDGRLADVLPAFAAGRVLVSMLLLDTIAVVDLDRVEVVWAHHGGFEAQHDPKILANGHLLLFDNAHVPGKASSVEEYDPATMKRVWHLSGSEAAPFYSRTCGAAQRLANGTTLITETDNGRAFEVTPEGEIVWSFLNPHRAGDQQQFIASLFEIQRLPLDFPTHWAVSPQAP
jgi:hypothetical protein